LLDLIGYIDAKTTVQWRNNLF